MTKDGRPDHEAAPHARYKMELMAACEQAIQENASQYQQLVLQKTPVKVEVVPTSISSMNVAAVVDPFTNNKSNEEKVEEKKVVAQLQTKTIVSTQSGNKLDSNQPAEFK